MFDYLIQHASILDGSGAEAFSGDLGICGSSIAAIGALDAADAHQVIDAAGRTLCPGFLDIHRHADAALFAPDWGDSELFQGLTTVLNGNCGLSLCPVVGPHQSEVLRYLSPIVGAAEREIPASLADYRRAAQRAKPPLHVGMLAGMGTLRACVSGFRPGDLSREELTRLHGLLETALADGAQGVSLGLGYAPECFYSTQGLLDALAPLRQSGVTVAVHMRQEGDGVEDALREMLTVARALETPVEISHLKAIGTRNWNRAVPEMLSLLSEARDAGMAIGCDVYPYPAGSTQLIHVLPPEFHAGGTEALTAALQDPKKRQEMRRRMESGKDFENISLLVGFEHIFATSLTRPEHRNFEGKSLSAIAQAQKKHPFDALFDLLAAEACTPSMIDFITSEDDVSAILRAPFSTVISDATYPASGLLHPRVYGAFPRLLETYVQKRHVLSLPEAIHKITRQSADRFGLSQKGRIQVGADADLCLFAPAAIHEPGTWSAPRQLAQGMDYVFVNGVPAIREGARTAARAGTVL